MNILDKTLKGTNENMKDNKNAYSEVIEILKLVDDEKKLEALPMEMLELLKSKANPEYKPEISKDIPLDEQNLQPETYALLNWITQKYWGDLEVEEIQESETSEIMEQTDASEKKEIQEEHIQDAISEHKENILNTENEQNTVYSENNLPISFDNLKWYEKIKTKIIELFNKIFKRRKSEETQEGNIL